jgi:hypothetical protein
MTARCPVRARPGRRAGSRTREGGQAIIQYLGILPFVLLFIFLVAEAYATVQTTETVTNAARTGAREASQHHDISRCTPAALGTLPASLTDKETGSATPTAGPRVRAWGVQEVNGAMACHVTAKVPLLTRIVPFDYTVVRTVRMPG